jgi:hypothetical protein
VKHLWKALTFRVMVMFLLGVAPVAANAQMSKVKTVWVILMENHNWTGNNTGAEFGAPDIKGNPLATVYQRDPAAYIRARGAVLQSSGEPS